MGQLEAKTVYEWECDSCKKVRSAPQGEVPRGFSGDATHVTTDSANVDDSDFTPFYACSQRCIGPAIKNVLGIGEKPDEDDEPAPAASQPSESSSPFPFNPESSAT